MDNTIIVFTSDHGYFDGEYRLNEERRLAYKEASRIPLLVPLPRAQPIFDGLRTEMERLLNPQGLSPCANGIALDSTSVASLTPIAVSR